MVRQMRFEHGLVECGDRGETNPSLEKRGHGDFVRRVQYGRCRFASGNRSVGQPETRELLTIRLLEVETSELGEIESWKIELDPIRIRERHRDRHPHIGKAELGHHRPVTVFDERMNDRLGMHDDIDTFRGNVEEPARFDHFETLPDQLELLRAAGFASVDCAWRYLNYAVFAAAV